MAIVDELLLEMKLGKRGLVVQDEIARWELVVVRYEQARDVLEPRNKITEK
ncbi:hypothetical protein BVRB_6g136010 [Beta vulgaris subsp. vulgaris]|nr:hypothetical protein BVRB_6g136010 [Beta vulgaris subsp. vulgaris]